VKRRALFRIIGSQPCRPANATNANSAAMGVTLDSWYRASTYITFLPCEL
jgi:hypothetical protein